MNFIFMVNTQKQQGQELWGKWERYVNWFHSLNSLRTNGEWRMDWLTWTMNSKTRKPSESVWLHQFIFFCSSQGDKLYACKLRNLLSLRATTPPRSLKLIHACYCVTYFGIESHLEAQYRNTCKVVHAILYNSPASRIVHLVQGFYTGIWPNITNTVLFVIRSTNHHYYVYLCSSIERSFFVCRVIQYYILWFCWTFHSIHF